MGHMVAEEARSARAAAWMRLGAMADLIVRVSSLQQVIDANGAGALEAAIE